MSPLANQSTPLKKRLNEHVLKIFYKPYFIADFCTVCYRQQEEVKNDS